MSDQIKHTPGPWVISRAGSTNPKPCGIRSEGVATGMICHLPSEHEDIEGNAALLAAAPELLHLLKGLLSTARVVDAGNKNQHGDDCHGFASELFDKCEAIITKAEGRDA